MTNILKVTNILIILFLISACDYQPPHHKLKKGYHIVTKKDTVKIHHNKDGIYYAKNDDNDLLIWIMITNNSASPSYVTYNEAPRYTTPVNFSSGVFVPVKGNQQQLQQEFNEKTDELVEKDVEIQEETIENEAGQEVPETECEAAMSESDVGSDAGSSDAGSSDGGSDGGGGD
jgi:hypothetical protein